MKKIRYSVTLLLLMIVMSVQGQIFVLDPLVKDSVEVTPLNAEPGENAEDVYIMMPKGMEITAVDSIADRGDYIFEYEGTRYLVAGEDLKFSSKNGDDVVNPFSDKHNRQHSAIGHFYFSYTPSILVLLLVVVSLLLCMISKPFPKLEQVLLLLVPGLLILASLIEIIGVLKMGSDVIWWCDSKYFGFWTIVFRAIPFAIFVLGHLASIYAYSYMLDDVMAAKRGEVIEENDDRVIGISLKPAAWGLGLCLPILIVVALITHFAGIKGIVGETLMLLAFFGTLIGGLVWSYRKNAQTYGAALALPVTIFSVVYIIGMLITAVLFVMVVVRIIIQILVALASVFAIIFVLGSVGSLPSVAFGGGSSGYRGKDGVTYSHKVDADNTYKD